MKIFLIILGVVVLAALVILLIITMSAPKRSDYDHLSAPRLTEKQDVLALIVPFDGNPDIVIKEAYTDLFGAYFKIKGAPKGPGQPAPVARYENFDEILHNREDMTSEELKSFTWMGFVAIPVPEGLVLPENAPDSVRLETLDYGTVAEVVHFGPYADETPVITALKEYIEEQGYVIAGPHEEEYILGPGMPFSNPEKYITMIRYQVEKE